MSKTNFVSEIENGIKLKTNVHDRDHQSKWGNPLLGPLQGQVFWPFFWFCTKVNLY